MGPRARFVGGLMASAGIFAGSVAAATVEHIAYHGWNDALRLTNGQVETIVVPEVGRVMSFRFPDSENVFWEDAELGGRPAEPMAKEWVNFGGDKAWPSPEAEWGNYTKEKSWKPPRGFDGTPMTARVEGDAVVLVSTIDSAYGVRVVRRIALAPRAASMTIETTFARVAGEPAKIGVWVISQFKDPVAVHVPIPAGSIFPHGHFVFRDQPWSQLTAAGGMIRLTRDPQANHKLGSDADRLLWVGARELCLVFSPREVGATYPDRGASTEVYTNADPRRYVELEVLGPLQNLKAGDRITRTNTYQLFRRTKATPDEDAAAILSGARQ